ncbi:hypothetical protein GJ744_002904 [Endocarpon pusillum]|uniref:Uncharacterized protein n=1 Tax=Endocarpon pusillum TaxID=364733 RepID=A0A8H7E063_9EURO|nr:hypothetical protein GJ744_002904 [Endocarpon pusillum]
MYSMVDNGRIVFPTFSSGKRKGLFGRLFKAHAKRTFNMLHITALPFNLSCLPGPSPAAGHAIVSLIREGSVKGQNVLTTSSFPFDKVRAMSPTAGLGCHLCTLPATVIDPWDEALLVDDIERPTSFIEDTFSIEYYVGTYIPQIQLFDP